MTINNKQKQIQELIQQMCNDSEMERFKVLRKGEMVDVGLINHFRKHPIIPNKWFDWERTVNSKLCIIGQDWGPYNVLKDFISGFDISKKDNDEYYRQFMLKSFTSRTEKFIYKAVIETYEEYYKTKFIDSMWDSIFFTMAVLFTRQGSLFRGNQNFDPLKSAEHSYKYLARQLEIVKPKVVMPLGNLALESVNRFYNLGYDNPKISEVVQGGPIVKSDVVIIPNYHPAAHVDPNIQMDIWRQIWKYTDLS